MKSTTIGAALTSVILTAAMATAKDEPKAKDEPGPVAAVPTLKEHKVLAREVGVWDADITTYLPGVAKPMTSKAVETNSLLGGHWLISSFKGEFAGMPFEGHSQTGFDAKKGKYVGTWLDSMSTRIDTLEGTYDEPSQTMTMTAELENPATGEPMKMKFVTTFKADNERVFTEYHLPEGGKEPVKFMEIRYKKK